MEDVRSKPICTINADSLGYHGERKLRRSQSNYWTHTSRGGAFGRKIWKKWFNNRAMNALEARLQQQTPADNRAGAVRYSLRPLASKEADTRIDRDSKHNEWLYSGMC